MIYLKRLLYILIMVILYILFILITILYVVFMPIGLIVYFILTEDIIRYVNPLTKLEEYIMLINNKLKYIFLE